MPARSAPDCHLLRHTSSDESDFYLPTLTHSLCGVSENPSTTRTRPTYSFVLSGLIPNMARDPGVPAPTAGGLGPAAGLLTSAFAVGMTIGAPLIAIASMRWPRRRALLTFLVTFMLVHVVGALTSS